MSDNNHRGEKSETYAVLMWSIAVIWMTVCGALAFYWGWLPAIPGFILLLLSSFSMAVEWMKSRAGRITLCFFLVLAGLAISWGMVLAACSTFPR